MRRLLFFQFVFSLAISHAQTAWTDDYVGRLQALAVVQTLNVELLSSRSATLTLERWCRDHRLAENPAIVAALIPGPPKAATTEQRERLQVTAEEEVRYRRVQLRCGSRVERISRFRMAARRSG